MVKFLHIFCLFAFLLIGISANIQAQKNDAAKDEQPSSFVANNTDEEEHTDESQAEWKQVGWACIYSKGLDGGKTSSGKRLDLDALTAAHKTLPFGTKVKVTNLSNGKSVIVKITDRGPYSKKFIIDMTPAAAKKIGLSYSEGITKVRLTKI